jgi:hypothetical protein
MLGDTCRYLFGYNTYRALHAPLTYRDLLGVRYLLVSVVIVHAIGTRHALIMIVRECLDFVRAIFVAVQYGDGDPCDWDVVHVFEPLQIVASL